MSHHLSAPQWELHSEYPGFDSPANQSDLERIEGCIQQLIAAAPALEGPDALSHAKTMAVIQKEADLLLYNLSIYAHLHRSTDAKNNTARTALDRLRKLGVKLTQSLQPLQQFVLRSSDEIFTQFLAHPELSDSQFYYAHQRETATTLLPLEHENLLSGLRLDGHHAWGHLYTNLTGAIEQEITLDGEKEVVGVAYLLSLLSSKESEVRQLAYENLNAVFSTHQETCAAILNALAGWRLEMCKRRSTIQPVDFLSEPLHSNRMQRSTLNTMIETSREHRGLGQKVLKLQARLLNKPQIDPWDGQAPAPEWGEPQPPLPFDEAMDIVVNAFNEVDPSMGSFARMMQENQWIDAADLPHKTPGAFCAGFPKSRTPRVLMTYTGTASNLTTLAHELGHAFHSWIMRDMPLRETRYPMCLAETASTFAETVVRQYLLRTAKTPEEKLRILWEEVSAIPRFLINLPVRYEFERQFYEAREFNSFSADEFKALMADTWQDWHGDSMSASDDMFWASKLHFYMAERSFYNFPYTFGYLFSQGIYAQREKRGSQFFAFYTELLRDTGRMQVEDLVQKHFQKPLDSPVFWQECVHILEQYTHDFEDLLTELKQ